MSAKSLAAVVGLGLGAEVLRRSLVRSTDIPAQVSAAAADTLRGLEVNPCSPASGRATDFTRLYVQQKQALIAEHGGTTELVCSRNGFGACVPNPFKRIPTAPAGCTLKVALQWSGAARDLVGAPGTPASLREDLDELGAALDLQAALVRGMPPGGPTQPDVNARVWSTVGRLSIALAGVHINHGDAQAEAGAELAKTVTDPSSYAAAAADVLAGVAGIAGDLLGPAAGALVGSNLGAIAIVAGAGYAVWRYT